MRIRCVRLRLFWAWFDLWVGAYWSSEKHTLYVSLIPTVVLALEFGRSPMMWVTIKRAARDHVLGGAPLSLGMGGKVTKDENGVITDFEPDSVDITAIQEQE